MNIPSFSSKKLLLPSLLGLSIINLLVSSYILVYKSDANRIKYVEFEKILNPITQEASKIVNETYAIRTKELDVIKSEIDELEQKKQAKGWLTSKQKKELTQKKEELKKRSARLLKEKEETFIKMVVAKVRKVNDLLNQLAQSQKCTIQPIQTNNKSLLKPAMYQKDNCTQTVLKKLGLKSKKA